LQTFKIDCELAVFQTLPFAHVAIELLYSSKYTDCEDVYILSVIWQEATEIPTKKNGEK
jgi:hypothetical protein